ncbi:SRPBCC family protein [Homoserinimonas sp. A447]
MPVVSEDKDVEALTMTFVAEFDASVERVWQLWEDPRKLERWWGPPTWPATFTRHEFEVGGRSDYYMTGPDGEKAGGWWQFTAIDSPTRLEFDDGFADNEGMPMDELGTTHAVVTIEPAGGKTRMTLVSNFASTDQLEKMVEMGMEEGLREALRQIEAILTEVPA